ncbi:hypothetical protein OIU78_026622 [Salix suchowensis]|nr:hypothetical protein OIU78_026622 [Salix suchowensis]
MQKAVLKLDLHGEKARKKAMKTVSSLPGVERRAEEARSRCG